MLKFNNVSYSYPHSPAPAVDGLSFSLAAGEIMLCTGRSGCGKSTLVRLADGLCPHYLGGELTGDIYVARQNTRKLSPQEISLQAGTLFQDPERQFFAMTVGDEIGLALQWRGAPEEQVQRAVTESAARLGIGELLGQTIFGLSEGQKQKVALAALLAQRPRLLVLDEPSANLDPESTAELARILAELKAEGLAILVVDHRLAWLRGVADKVLVLDAGRVAASGSFDLLSDEALRQKHGLRAAQVEDPRPLLPMLEAQIGEPFFGCRDINFTYPKGREIFRGASFGFPAGETVALTGENGVGKTTLSRLLTGLNKPKGGAVLVRGQAVKPSHLPRHAQVVLQNAAHQLRMNSVLAEVCDAADPGRGLKQAALGLETLESYGLEQLKDRHPQSLSGGEKQRLALACATIRRPEVLLMDEPTSGLDGENMRRIAQNVEAARASGSAVLVITHDLELMRLVCKKQLRLNAPN